MAFCKVILLVAFLGLLQCDSYQTAECDCRCDRRNTIQFRIPNLNSAINTPFYVLPYPYLDNASNQTTNQTARLQPTEVKVSIPSSSRSGWAHITIDTKKQPNMTIPNTKKPKKQQKTELNIVVEVKNENKGTNDGSEPTIAASEVSATKDKNDKHLASKTVAGNSKSTVDVTVDMKESRKFVASKDDDSNSDKISSIAKANDGNGNEAEAGSAVKLSDGRTPTPAIPNDPVQPYDGHIEE